MARFKKICKMKEIKIQLKNTMKIIIYKDNDLIKLGRVKNAIQKIKLLKDLNNCLGLNLQGPLAKLCII